MKLTGIEIFDKLLSEEQQDEIIKKIEDKFTNKDFTEITKHYIGLVIDDNMYDELNLNAVLNKYRGENYGWGNVVFEKFCSNGYDPKICRTDKIKFHFLKIIA